MTVADQFLKPHKNTAPLSPDQVSTALLSLYCVAFLKVAHMFASVFFMIFSCFLEDIEHLDSFLSIHFPISVSLLHHMSMF